jgi:hypothetical protein
MTINVMYHFQTPVRELFFAPIHGLSNVTARKDVQTKRMQRCVALAVCAIANKHHLQRISVSL